MQEVFEKIIEKLEERTSFLSDCTKYGNKDAEQQKNSYSTMMMYEVADLVDDLIEIVKQEAEQYEECYKDCGDCEAYNKEKHHCPKFCKVIMEAVNEIEENHNGWIPCSVRIPTEQERWLGHDLTDAEPREFIVMVKGAYEPTTGYYHSGYGCWVKDLTSEYDDKNTGYGNEIVAWRFFPQPYQPKGE